MEEQMEMPTVKSVALKWGAILGAISIVLFLVSIFGDLVGNTVMTYIGIIPTALIIFLGHKEFKENGDSYMSYGQGLGIGTLISLISSIISMAFFYVYISFVDGGYVDIIKDKQIADMQANGMGDAQIEQAMAMSESFMTPGVMALFGLVGSVFFGFLISLIISAITKKSNPELDL